MRHIRLTLQYDGTDYSGWQVQDTRNSRLITIQGILQEAIRRVTAEDTKVIGGSRTDAGVHALAQVASFRSNTHLETETLKRALNANLPDDIRIMDVCEVDEGFHPRYSAKMKVYSYLISSSQPHSVFLRRYTWQIRYDLSAVLDAMREASRYITGEHDFSSFRASGCGSKNPIRVIYDIDISDCPSLDFLTFKIDARLLKITISANAFLRHMARNIVGTLYDIARGRFSPSYMKELLILKDRRYAGITAPPQGLFLERIIY
ncbi:MAG: tRNA pseudouridine(38-40) synthase TruA [Thermodesulfovibrionia bacterium]